MLLLQVTYYLGLICLLLLLFPSRSRAYLSLKLKLYFYVNVTTNQTSRPIHTSITRRLLQFTVMQHTYSISIVLAEQSIINYISSIIP